MKELIEDYKRKLKTVTDMLLKMKDSGSVNDIKKFERLNTKASEYRSFIVDLERAYNKEISAEDIYCFQVWYGEHMSYVYLNREQAEKAANEAQAVWKASRREVHKDMSDEQFEAYYKDQFRSFQYKVQSLDDAIRDTVDNALIENR